MKPQRYHITSTMMDPADDGEWIVAQDYEDAEAEAAWWAEMWVGWIEETGKLGYPKGCPDSIKSRIIALHTQRRMDGKVTPAAEKTP